jgi:cytochrome bd-type quinol oxidase subunit 1
LPAPTSGADNGYDTVSLLAPTVAFMVSFHIIFPSFTIGLATWLAVLAALDFA